MNMVLIQTFYPFNNILIYKKEDQNYNYNYIISIIVYDLWLYSDLKLLTVCFFLYFLIDNEKGLGEIRMRDLKNCIKSLYVMY